MKRLVFLLFFSIHVAATMDGVAIASSALVDAIADGDVRTAENLLAAGANPNGEDVPPILWAVWERNLEAVLLLIAYGADIDLLGPGGLSAIHVSATFGYDDMIRQLIGLGADVENLTALSGETALMLAASVGWGSSVRILLSSGADPNATSAGGGTALMRAALIGANEVVHDLLAHGADATVRNVRGMSALDAVDFAISHGGWNPDEVGVQGRVVVFGNEAFRPNFDATRAALIRALRD